MVLQINNLGRGHTHTEELTAGLSGLRQREPTKQEVGQLTQEVAELSLRFRHICLQESRVAWSPEVLGWRQNFCRNKAWL